MTARSRLFRWFTVMLLLGLSAVASGWATIEFWCPPHVPTSDEWRAVLNERERLIRLGKLLKFSDSSVRPELAFRPRTAGALIAEEHTQVDLGPLIVRMDNFGTLRTIEFKDEP